MLAEFGNFLLPLLYKTWQTKPIPLQGNSVGATVLSVKHEHAEWVHYLILVILCVENGHQKSSSFTWCGVLIKHASLNNLCKKKKTTQNTRSNSISIPFLMLLYRLILNNRIMPKDRCFLNIFFVHGKRNIWGFQKQPGPILLFTAPPTDLQWTQLSVKWCVDLKLTFSSTLSLYLAAARIFSSTLFTVMSLRTRTSFFWPIRWARSWAWRS